MKIEYVSHETGALTARSGMLPLHYYVDSSWSKYEHRCARWEAKSWTVGHVASVVSNAYYGSAWNSLVPCMDEWSLFRQMHGESDILHFLWGEFATPSMFSLFRRKAKKIVGTFHCSQRRQWRVTMKPRWYLGYDHIVFVSKTQCDYFIDNGHPEGNMSVIPLGIDVDFFSYSSGREESPDNQLKCVMVGNTERDHVFAAQIINAIGKAAHLTVCTAKCNQHYYDGQTNVEISPYLSDEELVKLYQHADLLLMPMLDCTANDAILESMSCGTPVMVNCVGGIPEYVDPKCNFVMIGKKMDEWVDVLKDLAVSREHLWAMRPKVRAWAERFDWRIVAKQYVALYERVLGS